MVKGKESRQNTTLSLEDGISLLPDCLLVEIISRLPSTNEAIKTGTLSKRWQHLWTQLPNLIIKHDSVDDLPQFYSSIERILTQRGQSNLNKFQLHASCTIQTESQVNNCIRNAINHNVQEVDLALSSYPLIHLQNNDFILPEFFFICSSFIHLTLRDCRIDGADSICWKNLKSLCLKFIFLYQELIEDVLSGSPVLETLELHYCCDFDRLDITNESVKNLVFSGYHDYDYSKFEINAPFIQSLTIQGSHTLKKLLLLNVSSLIKAELNYYNEPMYRERDCVEAEENMLEGLLLSLDHVKEVKIGESCLEVLARLKAKGFICPSNLKILGEINAS